MFNHWKYCSGLVALTAVLLVACAGNSEPEIVAPTPIVEVPTLIPVDDEPTPAPVVEDPTSTPAAENPTAVPVTDEPTPPLEQNEGAPVNDPIRVQFEPGATSATLAGQVSNGEIQPYLLGAQEGQAFTAVFNTANNNQALMSVGIDGELVVDNQPSAALILPQTGDYVLNIHGRDAAPYAYEFTVEISALPTGLPLHDLTFADRATWLSFVGAPAECGVVDGMLQGQNSSGITFHNVTPGQLVVQIVCDTFAYSTHDRLYLYNAVQQSSIQLLVPEFDPATNVVLNRDILWGSNFTFDAATQQFTNFQKGRGLGDCGAFNRYQLTNNSLTLIEARMRDCVEGDTPPPPPQEWPIVYPTQ